MGGRHPAGARRGATDLRRRDRRPGWAFPLAARKGAQGRQFRSHDLAAPARAGYGERTALPRTFYSFRPPLPSRLTAAIPARFDDLGTRHVDEAKRKYAIRARCRRVRGRAWVAPGAARRPG